MLMQPRSHKISLFHCTFGNSISFINMFHIKLSTILLVFFTIASCNSSQQEGIDEDAEAKTTGKLWKANYKTTEGIENMKGLIMIFKTTPNKTVESYRHLGENLEIEFNKILENCTMEGEAHDQLHKYLMPMKDIFATLSENEVAACDAALVKLEGHLESYKIHFE
jgi:hypothetical protein